MDHLLHTIIFPLYANCFSQQIKEIEDQNKYDEAKLVEHLQTLPSFSRRMELYFLHLSRFLSGLCSLACKFLRTLLPWYFLPFDKVTAFKQLSFLSFIPRFTQLVESAALVPCNLKNKGFWRRIYYTQFYTIFVRNYFQDLNL